MSSGWGENAMKELVVYAADIGSVRAGNFGWARLTSPAAETGEVGHEPSSLADHVAADLARGLPVALGFECPLWLDVREDPSELTKARSGEGNRAWSAGAGSGALATGLVQTAWILRRVSEQAGGRAELHLEWEQFVRSGRGLYVWEAFVTKGAKAGSHSGDARVAAEAFLAALPNPQKANAVVCTAAPYSMLGAAMLWSGLTMDVGVLRQACLVIMAGEHR